MKNLSNKSVQKTGTGNANVETAVEVKAVEVETVVETTGAETVVEITDAETVVETTTAETIVETDSTEIDDVSPGENEAAEEKGIDFYLSEEGQNTETASQSETKSGQVVENTAALTKFRIAELKRSLSNKNSSLERERAKVVDWRTQAVNRDSRFKDEYDRRKEELDALQKKNEERYAKRTEKTKRFWIDYCDNYEKNKIAKIENDILLLEAELNKIDIVGETKSIAD